MSHDFIRDLARNIQQKDERELLEKEHQLHVAKVFAAASPGLWEDLQKKLNEFVLQLRSDLGNPTLANDLVYEKVGQQVNIRKTEFPCVTATLNFGGRSIDMGYRTENPRCSSQAGMKQLKVDIRVSHNDEVHLELEGRKSSPHDVAEHIMKLLFSV